VFESQFRRDEIDVFTGTASFARPHTIRVANQEREQFCDADYVLITAGSRPAHNDGSYISMMAETFANQALHISLVLKVWL
jgi:pyruvate/2-oxoglutarate dehydrogenase complex dihydrolipoamide dehydrogenase (E3) component